MVFLIGKGLNLCIMVIISNMGTSIILMGEMKMELWDIYNKYRKNTGNIHQRGIKTKEGEYHLAVRVWIVNSKNELLIQRRQLESITWPGMWDASASGSAILGDNSKETAIKETMEEIGLDISGDILEPIFTVKFKNGFDDNYLVHRELNIEDLKLGNEEVLDAKWATMHEIREMVSNEEFIPFPFLDRIFQIIESGISIIRTTPHSHPMGKQVKESNIGEPYRVFYKGQVVGNILVFEKELGWKKLHLMHMPEEFQNRGIEEEIIKRIESLYPEVEKWELETKLDVNRMDHIYEDMGYVETGETGMINEILNFVNYIKEEGIYRVDDIKDLKNK